MDLSLSMHLHKHTETAYWYKFIMIVSLNEIKYLLFMLYCLSHTVSGSMGKWWRESLVPLKAKNLLLLIEHPPCSINSSRFLALMDNSATLYIKQSTILFVSL